MVQLEHLMRWTIIACLIAFVGYVICWLIQMRMNKNVLKCLEENIKAWKDYEKAANHLWKVLQECYENIREHQNDIDKELNNNRERQFDIRDILNEARQNLTRDIMNLSVLVGRNHKKSLHIIDKINGNNNCSKEQSLRDSVQWIEGDRPRRKYTRRNNASKNS